ncbi:YqaJ viral recombinase family protein [Lelliottia wanjuensis]|uniref:YqaJ viral recombinase family protein n=3 Tax=Lelliottia wanjuensis TaxID=3050585 RepID=A0AAP4FZ50_9ENTR|nr:MULTISPECIES: YqaJ viral recombinase family protein [unclassified Lelliottia]MDK9366441.1 YqaJ viral recombinase family protein [Lelliottia sp. V106_12]MDK9618690.1 YqaJ viral recombinase family protein [Lelliottia sp. V106_9]
MSYDLASLMKMGMEDLAELAIKYDAPMSSSMNKKELAREVYRAYGAHAASEMNFLMEEENIWVDSGGIEHTLLSGQSFMQMDGVDSLLPSEVATDLLASDSAASAFAYAYRNPQTKIHNDILATLRQAGVNPDSVYGQLSSEYRNSSYVPLPRELKSVLNTFEGYTSGNNLGQDILGGMSGYFGGNDESLMGEFTTPKDLGGLQVQQAIEQVAAAYVSRSGYASDDQYNHDLAKVSRRIQAGLGTGVQSIATQIALEKSAGKDTFTSYADILPSSLSDGRLAGVSGAALPDKVAMASVRKNMRGIAAVYGYGSASSNTAGVTGLGVAPTPDERISMVNDLMLIHGDEPDFMAEGGREAESALTAALRLKEEQIAVPAGAASFIGPMPASHQIFIPPVPQPQFAPETPLGKAPSSTVTKDGITFHSVEQNSPEWFALRSENITASMAGSLLGHNKHSEPLEAVFDSLGFNPFGIENTYNHHFERGHRLEEVGRSLYEARINTNVGQTGFVTNEKYPGLGVSPDGLVGDDGLVEFKAPAANQFFDPLKKPEYIDQVQMQMAVTGRKWADLTQVGSNYGADGKEYQWLGRVDRIHADPKWAEQNAEKLQAYGEIIKSGRPLLEAANTGGMSKEEFIDVMSRAVAKGNVEGAELLRQKTQGLGNNIDRVGNTSASGYGYGRGVQSGYGLSGYGAGGSGGGDGYRPNWSEGRDPETLLLNGPTKPDADFDDLGSSRKWKDVLNEMASDVKAEERELHEQERLEDKAKDLRQIRNERFSNILNSNQNPLDKLLAGISAVQPEIGVPLEIIRGVGKTAYDTIDTMNEEFGRAHDVGISNASIYTNSWHNFEALGLNQNQSVNLSSNIGAASALLAAGDPSAAGKIVQGSRGLLSYDDIQRISDPSQLVMLAAKRAHEQGLSDKVFAGRMLMSGLDGAGRAYYATDAVRSAAIERSGRTQSNIDSDIANATNSNLRNGAEGLNLGYIGAKTGEHLYTTDSAMHLADGISSGINSVNTGISKASDWLASYINIESGGNPNSHNPTSSASGLLQVKDSTADNPGFGLTPAANHSNPEKTRVGLEIYNKLLERYNGDGVKASLAMHEGVGHADKLFSSKDWSNHLNPEEQSYYDKLLKAHVTLLNSGASTFAQQATPQKEIVVKVQTEIKGDTANTTITNSENRAVARKRTSLNNGVQRYHQPIS